MSTKSIIIKWGLIGGLITIIVGLLSSYLLGMYNSKMIQYVEILLMIAILVFGLFEYRDKLNGGFASFKELFKVGLMIGLVFAIISTIWSLIYINFIDTELIARTLLQTEIKLEAQGLSDKVIKDTLKISAKMMKPAYMAIMGIASTLIISSIISLVSALVIKNEKPFVSLDTDNE